MHFSRYEISFLPHNMLFALQVRMRWETEGFVWKLSDSCHQHIYINSIRIFDDDIT
jgi:hypothetical protein